MNIREFLWDYPTNLLKLIRKTAPISFLIIFGGVFSVFFIYLLSSESLGVLILNKSKNRIVEGTVGSITNLNPLYIPTTQAERDVEAMLFTKFIEISVDGKPIPSIAERWVVTGDYTKYEFTLREDLKWHDGELITVDDVVYTFKTAIDLSKRLSQDTIGQVIQDVIVKKVDDKRVLFTIPEKNATFFEAISVYIVPEHILGESRLNDIEDHSFSVYPVGSGDYKIIQNNSNGVVLENTDFNSNNKYYEYRIFRSYHELELAFRNGLLDIISGVPSAKLEYVNEYKSGFTVYDYPLYFRKKILFFNNRIKKFSDVSLRKGLNYITDKESLLDMARIDGTISKSSIPANSWVFDKSLDYYLYNSKKAKAEFKAAGYIINKNTGYYESSDGKILSFTLTYLDNETNFRLADSMKKLWQNEGILLELEPLNMDRLSKEVLATRDFEILLYEIELTVDPDQYDLWHSLRIDYPYLNLSGYNYERADVYIERAREAVTKAERKENYILFQRLLMADAPVIFLYDPSFYLVVANRIKGFEHSKIKFPSDRYSSIEKWYVD